jgi:zona occludens toxin (predicted ATPase)
LENKAISETAKPVGLHASNADSIINSLSIVTFADGSTTVINVIGLFCDRINQRCEEQVNDLDLLQERLVV